MNDRDFGRPLAAGSQWTEPRRLLREGREAYKRGELEDAIAILQAGSRSWP